MVCAILLYDQHHHKQLSDCSLSPDSQALAFIFVKQVTDLSSDCQDIHLTSELASSSKGISSYRQDEEPDHFTVLRLLCFKV